MAWFLCIRNPGAAWVGLPLKAAPKESATAELSSEDPVGEGRTSKLPRRLQNLVPCESEHRGRQFLSTWVPGTWQLTYTEAAKERGGEQQGT